MVAAVGWQPDQLEHPLGGSAGYTNPLLLLSRNGVRVLEADFGIRIGNRG
jgi:hypothetical protein